MTVPGPVVARPRPPDRVHTRIHARVHTRVLLRAFAVVGAGLVLLVAPVLGPGSDPSPALGSGGPHERGSTHGAGGTTPRAAAWAHGALAPPTAVLRAEDHQVVLHWRAAEDDVVALAVAVGQLPRSVLDDHLVAAAAIADVSELEPLVATLAAEVDQASLAADPALEDYLLTGLDVTQAETPCPGSLTDAEEVLARGLEVRFACPAPVAEVAVTITLLAEQDPTHTTFSTDGRGDVAVHTSQRPTHRWDLAGTGAPAAGSAAGSDGPRAVTTVLLPAGVGLLLAGGVVVGALARLRRGGGS